MASRRGSAGPNRAPAEPAPATDVHATGGGCRTEIRLPLVTVTLTRDAAATGRGDA